MSEATNTAPISRPRSSEVHLWIESSENAFFTRNALNELLAPDDWARAGRFHDRRDAMRYVCAHAMLRMVLSAYTGHAPQKVRFSVARNGKPCLVDGGDIYFNMSHSSDIFVIAVASGREVGVDIETLNRTDDMEQIAGRIMTPAEYRFFAACDDQDRTAYFYRCWVRKEAVVKAWGTGISDSLNTFAVFDNDVSETFRLVRNTVMGNPDMWTGMDFSPGESAAGAVCVDGFEVQITMMDSKRVVRK
jgi:4'-phosphopantetheinyl transferase